MQNVCRGISFAIVKVLISKNTKDGVTTNTF